MIFNESKILTNDPKDIKKVILGENEITIEEFVAVARYGAVLEFSDEYCERVNKSRKLVEKFLKENRRIYGVTTGFGENVRYAISPEDAETLQKNIVRSHACSVGRPLEKELVRAIQLMMLLNTGKGYSGISLETIELIKKLLNNGVTPYAPGEGSVGYLGVEGQITLVLMGEGKAWYEDELVSGDEALKRTGLKAISLKCKEGLSLLNGTTSATALSILAIYDAVNAAKAIDITGALTFEALKATIKACDKRLHSMKKHIEQQRTAENILTILKDSEIAEKYVDSKVQDAYALRCTPQMHGASKRILREGLRSIYDEMNSVSDNPIIYPEGDDGVGLMGGNFDGSYVGSHADCACIAMATLAKLSERRIDRMVNRHLNDFPAFLVKNPGLNNGYMIPQYTAAGLVGEIKVLSHPSTIDSISTCANQEDPVSLAYFASKKAYEVARKLQYIIAIELMVAAQALDFLKPLKSSKVTKAVYDLIREKVETVDEDRHFHPDMEYIYELVREGKIVKVVKDMIGELDF